MRVRQAAARIAVIGLIFMTACASTGPSPAVIDLAVSPEGVVMLDGQPVMMQRLPSALKAEGANRSTGIYVDVPSGASSDMLRGLTETLATAGYTRVIFRTPVKASAVTD